MIEFGHAKDDEKSGKKSSASSSYSSDLEGIMSDLLDAIASKDPKTMASAFKAAHEACASAEEDSEQLDDSEMENEK